jgi:hypothetical protein
MTDGEDSRVFLRLTLLLEGLGSPFVLPEFETGMVDEHEVIIGFKLRRSNRGRLLGMIGSAEGRCLVDRGLLDTLLQLANGTLEVMPDRPPLDSPNVRRVSRERMEAQGGWEEWIWDPFTLLPVGFREFSDTTRDSLRGEIERLARLARWRTGGPMANRIPNFRSKELSFLGSLDHNHWFKMPRERRVGASAAISDPAPIDGRLLSEAFGERLLRSGDEPVAHQLLTEAWHLRSISPTSSLVVGIAAVEVGFKQWATGLSPQEAPRLEAGRRTLEDKLTQDLPRILRTYLGHRWAPPPKLEVMDVINEGIRARNAVVHFPPGTQRFEAARSLLLNEPLQRLLLAVNDFLWILDVYSGADWAINNVQRSTLEAWERQLG